MNSQATKEYNGAVNLLLKGSHPLQNVAKLTPSLTTLASGQVLSSSDLFHSRWLPMIRKSWSRVGRIPNQIRICHPILSGSHEIPNHLVEQRYLTRLDQFQTSLYLNIYNLQSKETHFLIFSSNPCYAHNQSNQPGLLVFPVSVEGFKVRFPNYL